MNKLSVASFTNLGYLLHARNFKEFQPDIEGKTVVVTGATGGIGRETIVALSGMGARVIGVGRNEDKLDHLSSELPGPNRTLKADLSLMADVRSLADEIENSESVDVLINNVGVLLPEYQETSDGLEKSFATNIAGHFLVTNRILPGMVRRGQGRVIEVSSGGMYGVKIQPERLQVKQGDYNGTFAYAQAKRAQVILTEIWAANVSGFGVTVNSMHPGWVATPGVSYSLPTFNKVMKPLLRDVSQGADTVVWLASSGTGGRESGKFWFDRMQVPTHLDDDTREGDEDRREMWATLALASGSDIDLD